MYNVFVMGKKYSKKVVRKTKIRISPKDAEEIFRAETTDARGSKFINIIRFKPQSPKTPDFTQTVEYLDDKKGENKK